MRIRKADPIDVFYGKISLLIKYMRMEYPHLKYSDLISAIEFVKFDLLSESREIVKED